MMLTRFFIWSDFGQQKWHFRIQLTLESESDPTQEAVDMGEKKVVLETSSHQTAAVNNNTLRNIIYFY